MRGPQPSERPPPRVSRGMGTHSSDHRTEDADHACEVGAAISEQLLRLTAIALLALGIAGVYAILTA